MQSQIPFRFMAMVLSNFPLYNQPWEQNLLQYRHC
jgi:hypothetical protein